MPELYLIFEEIYDLFDQISAPSHSSLPKRFYISREQNTDKRIETEEQQIIDSVIQKKLIQKVYLEQMDFLTQVSLFRQAELVIAPHGAGLVNMILAPKNTALLELNKKFDHTRYLRNCFYLITAIKKQRYFCLNLSNMSLSKEILAHAIDQLID